MPVPRRRDFVNSLLFSWDWPAHLPFVYFTRFCPELAADELAAAPEFELFVVLGLGGRLLGALEGLPPAELF